MKDEALKLALEVLKAAYVPADLDEQREKAIAACEQALAVPVQEPLGYIASMAANDLRASIYRDVTVYGEDLEDTVAIYTTPPAQPAPVQEPVAKHYMDGGHLVYPAAQRQWVGLTDEEIDTWNIVGHESLREFVRAIEAKLKEKNT